MKLNPFDELAIADEMYRSQKRLESESVNHCDDMCGCPDVCDSGIGFPELEAIEQGDRELEDGLLGL